MKKPMKVLAEGLGHPEGPYPLPDGRVVFANTKVEIVTTSADGVQLNAPNDLTFGPDGNLYFTDSGDWDPETKPHPGYVCTIEPDGTAHILEELEPVYPNGIVAEPDGSIIWVESYTRRVIRRRVDGTKTLLATLAENHVPDGLKIDEKGNLWITSFSSGGIDILSRDGTFIDFLETGGVPLNCVFSGSTLFVCDFGTTVLDTNTPMGGRLLSIDVGVTGMPLFKGHIALQ
jgi:gluconolactonase